MEYSDEELGLLEAAIEAEVLKYLDGGGRSIAGVAEVIQEVLEPVEKPRVWAEAVGPPENRCLDAGFSFTPAVHRPSLISDETLQEIIKGYLSED